MRLIDAYELMEHAGRDRLDSRELIMQMIEHAPTVIPEGTHLIKVDDLQDYCDNSRDHSIPPNEFQRFPHIIV